MDRNEAALEAQAPDTDPGRVCDEPVASDDIVSGWLARMKEAGFAAPGPDRQRCADLSGAETECGAGQHSEPGKNGMLYRTRRCPAVVRSEARARVAIEAKRLEGILERCGYVAGPDDQRNIGDVLFAGLTDRPIDGLPALKGWLRRYRDTDLDRSLFFVGSTGTGKTTAQLCLHFWQLQRGVNSQFVSSSLIRRLAKQRLSADPEASGEAEAYVAKLSAAKVLVWSDIGDKAATDPNFACTVQDILEQLAGCLVGSSNLGRVGLRDDPNIGDRATSRMFGNVKGVPIEVINLKGPDQREHRPAPPLRAVR